MTFTSLMDLVRKPVASSSPLADALRELDLQPFEPTSVATYKTQKKEEIFSQPHKYLKGNMAGAHRWVRGGAHTNEEVNLIWASERIGFEVQLFKDVAYQSMPTALCLRWRRMSLAEASASGGPGVPEFVARKAEQVAERVPTAVIEVDALESQQQFYDPFLVVKMGAEEYYIEVWDETSFNEEPQTSTP